MNNRDVTIDIAKGIGIILVVLGHNWLVLGNKGELYRVIYSFHIPLFLFLSGLFIKDSTSLGRFILSRADVLLKPYLVIFFLVSLFKAVIPTSSSAITVPPQVFFLRALYATPGYIIWEWLPLWYLPHLFVVSVLSIIALKATKGCNNRKIWIGLVAVVSMATGIWLSTTALFFSPRPPFTIDAAPISLAFVLIGFLLWEKVQAMVFNLPAFLLTTLAFFISHYFFDETIDLSLRLYSSPIISTLQAFLGIYIALSVSKLLMQQKMFGRLFAYIGSGSLFILLFHNFTQVRVAGTLSQFGYNSQISNITGFFMGIIFPLMFLELVKRQHLLSVAFFPIKARGKTLYTQWIR